jgi:DnaK suppressor protein
MKPPGPSTPRDPSGSRAALLDKRAEVLSHLGAKFDTIARMGRIAEEDQAQLSHDEHVSLSLNHLDYEELRLVDAALDRLETGDYGICQRCDKAIPARRLNVIPWAEYCVPCQEVIDREAQFMVDDGEYQPAA